MAQPPRYQRQKDFTVDYGSETDHGAINAELDDAAASINGIRTNLALIQRDDGKLVQGVVDADSVDPGFADELSRQVASGVAGALDDANAAAVAATLAANAADTSKAAAANSATSSATSASAAASSASSAAASSGIATAKANDATTSANNAAGGATSAAFAATNADLAANDSATSASAAASSATSAATSAGTATTKATEAATSATNAAASATAAAATYDAFDDRFLGAKASDPATDNDGNVLATGALYWNTTGAEMRIYTGSAWITAISGIPNDGAVTTAKLADGGVTTAKLNSQLIAGFTDVPAALDDSVPITDLSDAGKNKRVKVSSIAALMQIGPAFLAANSVGQSMTSGLASKITLPTEVFDTGNCFASSRFTPTVPGYYLLNYMVGLNATTFTNGYAMVYVNGTEVNRGNQLTLASGAGVTLFSSAGSHIAFFNGTTDYVEMYCLATGSGLSAGYSRFSGALIRNP